MAVYTFIATVVLFSPLLLAQQALLRPKIRQEIQGRKPEQLGDLRKKIGHILIGLLLIMTLLSAAVYVRALMHSYTNNAVTYFNQSITIVSPYVSPEEERRLRSDFARVSSKKDYVQLMQRLRDRATSVGVKLPEFSIW